MLRIESVLRRHVRLSHSRDMLAVWRGLPRFGDTGCVRRSMSARRATQLAPETLMAMLKVIEVLSESSKSWEDAAQMAVTQASETLHGVKSIYVKDMEATVENGKIRSFRINAKISFQLEGKS